MALEIYLRFDGIAGDTRNYSFIRWSDVLSWQWQLASTTAGGGGPAINEIVVRKKVGGDSPALMRLFALGETVAQAELRAVPAATKRVAPQKYIAVVLDEVRILSISLGGAAGADYFVEEIVLGFRRVSFEHSAYALTGPDQPAEAAVDTHFAWDVAQGQPA